jgi:hypothetical protein
MKTFTYNCPDCGQGGSVNTSEVESTEADEFIEKLAKIKRCDECSRLGGARIDAYRRLRQLEEQELRTRNDPGAQQALHGKIQAQVRSLQMLMRKIKDRCDVPVFTTSQSDNVVSTPVDELPF